MSQNGRFRRYGFAPSGAESQCWLRGLAGLGRGRPRELPSDCRSRYWRSWQTGFTAWGDAIAVLDPSRVWEPLGDREGVPSMRRGPEDPLLNVAQHINRELIHHGADVALLRDLYASQWYP